MDIISTIISIVVGLFGIVGGIYQFRSWWKARKNIKPTQIYSAKQLNSEIAKQYVIPQERALEVWRLFDFHRDIKITDIYVQEVLQTPKGSPFGAKDRLPPVLEKEVFEQICKTSDTDNQIWIIVGRAGSGKSTMLWYWTLCLLEELRCSFANQFHTVPIYLSLRHLSTSTSKSLADEIKVHDLTKCFSKTIPSISDNLAELPFLRIRTLRKKESIFSGNSVLFSNSRKKDVYVPEWIFFCDGFDELASEVRVKLYHWIKGLPRSCRVVLATRPNTLDQIGRLPRSVEYEICDFNKEQIKLFVIQWFRDNKQLGYGFLEQISSNESLYRLAVIPLLLTCLSMDVEIRKDATFPQNFLETDLLRRAIEIVIDRWDAAKEARVANQSLIQLGLKVFSELAIDHSYDSKIQYEELVACVNEMGKELGIKKEVLDEFLRRTIDGGRLLVGTQDCGFSFGHSVFYDFFFADGMRHLVGKSAYMRNPK